MDSPPRRINRRRGTLTSFILCGETCTLNNCASLYANSITIEAESLGQACLICGAKQNHLTGIIVERPLQKIFQFLYAPLFFVIDFFIRNYRANRNRLGKLMERQKASSFIQNAALVLLIAWILVFSLSSEESRNRLSESIKESFAGPEVFTEK